MPVILLPEGLLQFVEYASDAENVTDFVVLEAQVLQVGNLRRHISGGSTFGESVLCHKSAGGQAEVNDA